MYENKFYIEANGKKFFGFKSVVFKKSMDTICSSFTITFVKKFDNFASEFTIKEGDKIALKIDDDLILTGYVDEYTPNVAEEMSYTISGRDKCGDLVDCSAIYGTGAWKSGTSIPLTKIITDLITPFDIKLESGSAQRIAKLAVSRIFSIATPETVFECINRLLKPIGLLQGSDASGALKLLDVTEGSGRSTATGFLKMGVNIKSCGATYSQSDRFSFYKIIAESLGGGGLSFSSSGVSFVKAEAKDEDMKRYRPTIVMAEMALNKAGAAKRSEWERTIRMARSSTANVTVQGFRDDAGKLWDINTLISVNAPEIEIYNEKMLIKGIEYRQDETGGSTSSLFLGPENSYLPEAVKQKTARGENQKQFSFGSQSPGAVDVKIVTTK